MIIRCPNCKTGYNVPEEKLTASGRTVRCTQCSHTWLAKPKVESFEEKAPPLAPVVAATERSVSDTLKKEKQDRTQISKRIAVALIAVLFMAGALFGLSQNMLVQNEEHVIKRHQNVLEIDGLEIPEVSIERTLTEGNPTTLTFTGKVVNKTGATLRVPKILVSLHDEAGLEIDRWPAYIMSPTLSPNEETEWVCRFFDPELDSVSEHRVRFVE